MQWSREPVFSLPPVNNEHSETIEAMIERKTVEGWTFVALLPGQDHGVAEHRKPPIALFKKAGA
jgi:hypothetical protein